MTQSSTLTLSLQRLKDSLQQKTQPSQPIISSNSTAVFPLRALLQLYQRCQHLDYAERIGFLKRATTWLSPISRSHKLSCYIPIYLVTSELTFLSEILHEEPSKLWQEFLELERDSQYVPRGVYGKYSPYHLYRKP